MILGFLRAGVADHSELLDVGTRNQPRSSEEAAMFS